MVTSTVSLCDPATAGEHLFNYLLSHERRYGLQVLRMVSTLPYTDETTTEFVLTKQWTLKAVYR